MKYSPAELAEILGQFPPTEEQSAIIAAPLKPGITIAGAGSGKTTVIGLRVLYLIANGLVAPEQIIGLTFTNKAAGEMSDRIAQNLAKFRAYTGESVHSASTPTIQTYNAFAAGLVSEYGAAAGLDGNIRVIDDANAVELADRVVARAKAQHIPVGKSRSTVVSALIHLAGQLNEHLRTPHEVIKYLEACMDTLLNEPLFASSVASKKNKQELAEECKELFARTPAGPAREWPDDVRDAVIAFSRENKVCSALNELDDKYRLAHLLEDFAQIKHDNNAMQFSDQVAFAFKAVQADPSIVDTERAKWKVVFLDEYQDTSDSQVRLLTTLFAGLPVTAVGDPRQAIYAWRGASDRNIEGFADDFGRDSEPVSVNTLTVSFRNSRRVLDIANRIALKLPEDSPETRLRAREKAPDGTIDIAVCQGDPHEEYGDDQMASLVDWLADKAGHRAVLVRKRAHFASIEQALTTAGFDVQVVGDVGGLHDPYVADVFAAFNVVCDPHAAEHLMRLYTGRIARLGAHDVRQYHEALSSLHPRDESVPVTAVEFLDEFAQEPVPATRISPAGVDRLIRLAHTLRKLRSTTANPVHLARAIIRDLGIPQMLRTLPDVQAELHQKNLDAFVGAIVSYVGTNPHATLNAVANWLTMAHTMRVIEVPPEDLDPTAVTVMTVHAAKGLEFDAVALPHLSINQKAGDFPTIPGGYNGWLALDELPYPLRGDKEKLPQLDLANVKLESRTEYRKLVEHRAVSDWASKLKKKDPNHPLFMNRKYLDLEESYSGFLAAGNSDDDLTYRDHVAFHHRRQERRLAYVAVTRAKNHAWLGCAYDTGRENPNQISPFLAEAIEALNEFNTLRGEELIAVPDFAPADTDSTPVLEIPWPIREPAELVEHRRAVQNAALAESGGVELEQLVHDGVTDDEYNYLVKRALTILSDRADHEPAIPNRLAATSVVKLRADRDAFMRDLLRPMPEPPSDSAALGTAFHAWVEQRFGQASLAELDDAEQRQKLPGYLHPKLDELTATFEASAYSDRIPHAVELPFELALGTRRIPGKIDAVFKDGNRVTVVDWKTGSKPSDDVLDDMQVQLALYVAAAGQMPDYAGCDISAEFYFVGSDDTVAPENLPGLEAFADLALSHDEVI